VMDLGSDACSRPECAELRRHLEKLLAVAKAAERLIYPPRSEYAAGSKKAALRDALAALKDSGEKG